MSGFAGLWNYNTEPINKAILKTMGDTLSHRGPDGEAFFIEGSFGIMYQQMRITPEEMSETQPVVDSLSSNVLAFCGRLDNREDLLAQLNDLVGIKDTDANFVLAAYKKWGEVFVEKLVGEYAFSLFDKKNQFLLLVRDVIGVQPLYYYNCERFCAFASEIKALLKHPQIPCIPSDQGLAEYLIGNTQHNMSITCFKDIFAVEPSQIIKFSLKKEVSKRQYWDFDVQRKIKLTSIEEYAEAFYEHYKKAVKRRVRSFYPVGFSVSGGLDSSTIFALAKTLEKEGKTTSPLLGLTFFGEGHTRSDELSFLELLEKKYDVSFDRLNMASHLSLTKNIQEQVYQIEAPFVDMSWELSKIADKMVSQKGCRVVISGQWGDQLLFSQAYLKDLAKKFEWRKIYEHFNEFPKWFVGDEMGYLKGEFYKSMLKSYAPEFMLPILKKVKRTLFPQGKNLALYTKQFSAQRGGWISFWEKWPQPFHSEHAREVYYEVRKKYCVLCLEWNNKMGVFNRIENTYPMLDRDLISFLMAIEGEIVNLNGVPRGLLRRSMAEILPTEIAQRNWKADFSTPTNDGLNEDLKIISNTLNENSNIVRQGYVNLKELRQEVELAQATLGREDCQLTWSLAELYGFEHWLKMFAKGDIHEKKKGKSQKEEIQNPTP